MLRAMITPLTMYNLDNSVFDGITLPARPFTDRGYEDLFLTGWDMDKTVFINNLLLETAELNVLYTDPAFFKFAVTEWAKKERPVWQSLYETIFFKYNPIWNKDGTMKHTARETRDLANGLTVAGTTGGTVTETSGNTRTTDAGEVINRTEVSDREITEGTTGTVTDKDTPRVTDTETKTYNVKDERDYLTEHGGTVVTDKTESGSQNKLTEDNWTEGVTNAVSAFDVSTYQPREKTDTTHAGTGEENMVHSGTGKDTVTDTSTVSDTGDTTRTGTETVVTSHDGIDTKETEYNTLKTTNDNLTRHEDDTNRKLDETVTDAGNRSQTTTGTDNRTQTGTDTGTVDTIYTDTEQGNIGVTTTQQMIEAERELVRFNIYDVIIESFKQRFCLLIY